MSIEREIDKLRQQLMDEQPFWGILASRLKTVVGNHFHGREVKTAAVDGRHLFINPDFWNDLSLQERKTIFVHEVAHVGLGHHLRRDDRDQKIWNVAGDHEINLILEKQGFEMPDHATCDHRFTGWSAERIFADLPRRRRGEGVGPPSDDDPGENTTVPADDPDGDSEGTTTTAEDPGSNDKGDSPSNSSAGGSEETPGEVWDPVNDDGSEITEEQKTKHLEELTHDIQMADHARKGVGSSGDVDRRRATNRLIDPRMKWKNFLNRWITQRGKPVGRSWSKLDRRSMVREIYQPGEIKEGMDWLVLAVDVSSSIAQTEFRAFIGHIESIRKNIKIEKITLVPFNHVVQQEYIVNLAPKDKFPSELRVGGGTSFAPIFNWVRRQNKTPDGIIVFTDLCCDEYGAPARTSILWASTDEVYSNYQGWYSNKPPFGEVIQIDISQG